MCRLSTYGRFLLVVEETEVPCPLGVGDCDAPQFLPLVPRHPCVILSINFWSSAFKMQKSAANSRTKQIFDSKSPESITKLLTNILRLEVLGFGLQFYSGFRGFGLAWNHIVPRSVKEWSP